MVTKLVGFSKRRRNFLLELRIKIENRMMISSIKPVLIYYATLSDEPITIPYYLEIKKITSIDNEYRIKAKIKIDQFDFIPSYWDLALEINYNNHQKNFQKVNEIDSQLVKKIQREILFLQVKKNAYLFRPHINVNQGLTFIYMHRQPFENRINYIKEMLAFYLCKFFGFLFLTKNSIWLVSEKESAQAHDNGYWFFKWMRENHPEQELFFIIKDNSLELGNLANHQKNVLKFMSFKYFIYIYKSKLIISTDNKYHIYNLHQANSVAARAIKGKKEVYLQHGVNGLKQVPEFHKNQLNFNMIISPSNFETKMIIEQWGYQREDIATTGFSRWDSYHDKSSELNYKKILIMPTWRKDLAGISKSAFIKTSFFYNYQTLLNSKRLKQILLRNNVRISFFLHPYFKEYISLFRTDNEIIDKYDYLEKDLGQEIMESSLMISDYSSVLWDMYYLKKPLIFFQFDQQEFLSKEKTYMNYQTDLFGDCAFSVETVVDYIEHYVETDFKEDKKFTQMRHKYFTYMDQNNSKRIYQAIKKHEKRLGI